VYWAVEQARAALEHGHVEEGSPGAVPPQPVGARPFRPESERVQDALSHA